MQLIRQRSGGRRAAGFTLVELLVTLAVGAVVLTLAVPSFSKLLRQNTASTVVNDYVYALRLARSEAVTESMPVTLCQSSDGASCGNSNDWEAGWMVFRDPNADGDCSDADNDGNCDDGGKILLVHKPSVSGFEFSANGSGNPKNGRVEFDATGYAIGQPATFSLCDQRNTADARGVVLSMTGRPRMAHSGLNCAS